MLIPGRCVTVIEGRTRSLGITRKALAAAARKLLTVSLHSSALPTWDQLKYNFRRDGMLRDIRIQQLVESDHPQLLDALAQSSDDVSFGDSTKMVPFPANFQDWWELSQKTWTALRVTLGKIELNCWLLGVNEVEIDFWPQSVDRRNFSDLLIFLVQCGRAVRKDIVVTTGGFEAPAFLVYDYQQDLLRVVPEEINKREQLFPEELAELDQRDR